MRSKVMRNQNGFSLVETIIAQGITVLTLLVLGGFYVYASARSRDLEASAAIVDRMQEVRYALSRQGCSANLRGMAIDIGNPAGSSVPELKFTDAAGNLTESLLKPGVDAGGATPRRIQLIPIAQMSYGRYAAKLEIFFDKVSGATATRTINLLADVQAGRLLDCWAYQNPGETIVNEMCSRMSGANLNEFDLTTGNCTLRNARWEISNDPFIARCPAGSVLNPPASTGYTCGVEVPPAFVDPHNPSNIILTNGTVTEVKPSPFVYHLNKDQRQCECVYATDIPAAVIAQFRCRIRCVWP